MLKVKKTGVEGIYIKKALRVFSHTISMVPEEEKERFIPVARQVILLSLATSLAKARGLSKLMQWGLFQNENPREEVAEKLGEFTHFIPSSILDDISQLSYPDIGCPELLGQFFESSLSIVENHRRGYGIYYTPSFITDLLTHLTINAWFSREGNILKNISDIRILDPACGAGAFLLSAIRYLRARRFPPGEQITIDDFEKFIPCIVGMDQDPDGVMVAKLSLWIEVGIDEFEPQITACDTLLDRFAPPELFDIVLGNPPHVENKHLSQELKGMLSKNYQTARKLFDLSVPFTERSFEFLTEQGCMGLVLPNKIASSDYALELRRFFLEKSHILYLANLSSTKAFKNTSAYPILFVTQKCTPSKDARVTIYPQFTSKEYGTPITQKQKHLSISSQAIWDLSGHVKICERLKGKGTIPLGYLGRLLYRPFGFIDWKHCLDFVTSQNQTDSLKFIGCGNIAPFKIRWDKPFRQGGRKFINSYINCPPGMEGNWKVITQSKIIIREIALNLTAAYDTKGEYGYVTGIYGLVDISSNIDPYFLLLLLNSKILRFFFSSVFQNTQMAGGYLRFNGSYLKLLPIRRIPLKAQKKFSVYTQELIEKNNGSLTLSSDMEDEICDLYNIKSSDRKIILSLTCG